MKNDLSDTEEALVEDKKFLADMEKTCATKTAEWEVIVKTRNEELLSLSETIKATTPFLGTALKSCADFFFVAFLWFPISSLSECGFF